MKKDPRIDAYIAQAAPFAQPLLIEIRARVAKTCPAAEETIKWGFPHFMYQGKILCSMAAFKAHAAFGFWHGDRMEIDGKSREAMGQFGRLQSGKDLPSAAVFAKRMKEAMRLAEAGVVRAAKTPKPPLPIPPALRAALAENRQAAAAFDAFPPSHRREYAEWISEAKREETRQKRVLQAIAWIAEGKHRNWKYDRC